METVTLTVQGMTCGGCVSSVTRALKQTPGVADVAVTLQPGAAKVTYDPAKTEIGRIRSAIEDAGFDVAA